MLRDIAAQYFRMAMMEAMREGSATLVEELSEALTPEQLKWLIERLEGVRKKKQTVIDVAPNGNSRVSR